MPQPKSGSSSSRARKPAAKRSSAAAKPAAKRTAAGKPAAKRTTAKTAAASRPAAKRKTAAKRTTAAKRATATAASTTQDAAQANLTALRDTLRKGVVLTAEHVKSTLDDAVKRGRITRKDATELSQALMGAGRAQADGFRADLEQLLGKGRSRAAASSDRVLREVDRARRRVGVGPSFPISLYDDLNATQIQGRLGDLTPAQLRKVRDYEKRHDNRKSVLGAIERKLG